MKRYISRPRVSQGATYAAVYTPGESLDDLRHIARMKDGGAKVAEVPSFEVLLVRYRVTDESQYQAVEKGHVLVYSTTYDVLYTSSWEEFESDHVEAPNQ